MEELSKAITSLLEDDALSLDCAKVLTDLRRNEGSMLVSGKKLKYVVLENLGYIEFPKNPHYVEALYRIELTNKGRRTADNLVKESYKTS